MDIPSTVGHIQSLTEDWAETGAIQGYLILASHVFIYILRNVHAEATSSSVIFGDMRGAHAALATLYTTCAFNPLAYFCVIITRTLPSVPAHDMNGLTVYIILLFELSIATVAYLCNDRCPGFRLHGVVPAQQIAMNERTSGAAVAAAGLDSSPRAPLRD